MTGRDTSTGVRNGVLLRWCGIALAGVLGGGPVAGAEFSADEFYRGPQGVMSRTVVHVSGERVRTETSSQGKRLVQIRDTGLGQDWILYPADHAYLEFESAGRNATPHDPCSGLPGATCEKLGEEQISGRPVTHWEVVGSVNGQPVRSEHWIDSGRGIPLRQHMPDGTRIHWRLVGLDRIEGRHVEKWQVTTEGSGETPVRYFRWIDPELNVPLREEMPGGFVRELRNIRVGSQPEYLFSIPVGYRRLAGQGPPSRAIGPTGGKQ